MGIPRYFKYVCSNFSDLIIESGKLDKKINNLFLDMNCLIHPCVRKVVLNNEHLVIDYNKIQKSKKFQTDKTLITNLELKIYNEIDLYLDKLIKISNPDKLVYMAIDGVAPRAKMEQQRIRRFRSIKIKNMEHKIKKKFNCNISEHFDTNCITPGTIFMYKLNQHLKSYIDKKSKENNIKFILDDCQNIGEGEHKILQYVKYNNIDDINCIYGLDADLIMLSLITYSEIYLLREEVHFGKVDLDSFLYFNVHEFGEILSSNIIDKINNFFEDEEKLELDKKNIINDYICLCFLIGNDFLPHLNGIDISNNSINDLLQLYINIFQVRQKYLTDGTNVNFIFIRQIITNLFSNEHLYLNDFQKKKDYRKPRLKCSVPVELELEKLKYYPVFNKKHNFKLGNFNWMDKYYNHYFNIKNVYNNIDFINDVCNNYIEGIQWNAKYYLGECPSYTWYYKYRNGPCLRELSKFLIKRVYPTQFESETNFNPLEQLAIVLPPQSDNLWANNYKKYVKKDVYLQSFYPIDFVLDTHNKFFLHECNPILSDIDDKYIKNIFKTVKLNEFEKERNAKGEIYIKN
jgi:5'-3' exonuclease